MMRDPHDKQCKCPPCTIFSYTGKDISPEHGFVTSKSTTRLCEVTEFVSNGLYNRMQTDVISTKPFYKVYHSILNLNLESHKTDVAVKNVFVSYVYRVEWCYTGFYSAASAFLSYFLMMWVLKIIIYRKFINEIKTQSNLEVRRLIRKYWQSSGLVWK